MTIEEIRARVNIVRNAHRRFDDETAHDEEDKLFHDFVRWVSKHPAEVTAEQAREVLKSLRLGFSRYVG